MKRLLLMVLFLLSTGFVAQADGLPSRQSRVAAPAQQSWIPPVLAPTTSTNWTGAYAGYFGAGSYAGDGGSWDAGGALGYQLHWQSGLVLGLEADAAKTWFQQDLSHCDTAEIDFSGSLRARVGWATGPTLLYGTAGVGFQHVEFRREDVVRDRGMAAPWVYGLGAEYRATEQVSLKVEWVAFKGEAFNWDTDPIDRDTFRAGMNYKF